MGAFASGTHAQILDNMPHVIMRLAYTDLKWTILYVNEAIECYGYRREDYMDGKLTWNDLLHPDDRVVALRLSAEYVKKGIDDFKIHYRLLTRDGASIHITEYSHVNRNPDGSQGMIDSFLFENLEASASGSPESDAAMRRNLVLNDILLTIQDVNADPEKAIQFILDRVGTFLGCSRALLFSDSPDHKTCKVVHEWLNHGISSIKELDHAVAYDAEMPEIYAALQDTGFLLVNAGEVPENCREEFETEGLVSSAIFAVYQYGDHYGFVCFDDCVIQRAWDPETAHFLKIVANLLSNIIMHLQGVRYLREYEDKIKSLAFRDYLTGLPNKYPYDGDLGDVILSAGAAGASGYASLVAIDGIDAVRNAAGFKVANAVYKSIAVDLQAVLSETLGERGTLYRIAGTVFGVLIQPGPGEPVRAFAQRAFELGNVSRKTDRGDFFCRFNVAVVPVGVTNTDPERIGDLLDEAMVRSGSGPNPSPVFLD